jgi:hypothetical protein
MVPYAMCGSCLASRSRQSVEARPRRHRARFMVVAALAIGGFRALNAADPAAWAPFTRIGEAGP